MARVSNIPIRLVVVFLLIVAIGLVINYAARQAGFIIPFAWLPPLVVLGLAALTAWTVGGLLLVKRLWFWLWGAPWDAAGYIAGKSKKGSSD